MCRQSIAFDGMVVYELKNLLGEEQAHPSDVNKMLHEDIRQLGLLIMVVT